MILQKTWMFFISDLENDNAEKTHKSNNNNLLLTLKNVEHNHNK